MTPEQLAANADAVQAALAELGVTPQDAYRLEGEQRARERFSRAMQVATERGEASRIEAINARIVRDAETHARREMARMSRQAPQTLTGATVRQQPTPMPTMAELGVGAPPTTFTSALTPQSPAEADDVRQQNRSMGTLLEASGVGPAYRSGQAFSRGDIIGGVGNAAVAAMPYRPVAAAGALGAAYTGALGADLLPGMFGTSQAQAEPAGTPAADAMAGDREMLKGLIDQQATLRVQAEAARQRMEAERRTGEGKNFKAARDEYTAANARATAMDEQVKTLSQRLSPEAIQQRQEYGRAVSQAERGLAEARARKVLPFRDTNVGALYNATAGVTPAVFGAGTAALMRGIGRSRPEAVMEGALAGMVTPNAPLVWDMFAQPVANPEREAYAAYARDLPPDHPRRQEWTDYAARLPEENPIRRMAVEEFYDPLKIAERFGVGALEGAVGGSLGAALAEAPRAALRAARGRGTADPADALAPLAPQAERNRLLSPPPATPATTGTPAPTAPGATGQSIWPAPTRFPGQGAPPQSRTPTPPQNRLLSINEPPRGPSVIYEPMPPRPRSTTEQPVSTLETFGRGGTRASEMDPIPPPRPTGQSERQSSHAPADLPAFPDVAYRRQNPGPLPGGNWVAPGATARQNEIETWVSPGGRRAVTREPSGAFRGEDGQYARRPPRNWRRISSAGDAPSLSGPVNALMG